MRRSEIESFFEKLSVYWKKPTTILLLGGGGSLMLGGSRPTLDVDFEVKFHVSNTSWEDFDKAVRQVSEETGLGAQYAEAVDRWSLISFLDYRKHTRFIRKFGTIELRVFDPIYLSIGKIGRYWDQDIQDMIAVFKKEKPDPLQVAKIWKQALVNSPKSSQLALVRRQALHFFETFGSQIWGKSFSTEKIQELFAPKSQ